MYQSIKNMLVLVALVGLMGAMFGLEKQESKNGQNRAIASRQAK
jgi:hypothetical protein